MAKRSVGKPVMEGGPGGLQDGAIIEEKPQGEPEVAEEEVEEQPEAAAKPDPLADMKAELAAMRAELAANRPPAKRAEEKPVPPVEPDWEELLYKNPKEYARLMRESIRSEITTDLRNEYQSATSEDKFWSQFYKLNADLEQDDDLVRATLQRNLKDLENLPVETAAKKLADLTRDRILRYAGGGKQPTGKKVVVEGQNSPKPKPEKQEQNKVVTLSELIRNRKSKRAAGKSVAA